jgi:tetratricopeptide (TPR) repeat protein
VTQGDDVNERQQRPRALTILTALGSLLAAGALIAITAMTAVAAVPSNLGKALADQQRLAAARPQDATVFNDLGNLLVLAGQPRDAEAAFRHATELDPRRTSALFNLGLLLQQEGKTGEARQLYEKVLEIEPGHAWAHYQMGTLYERKGDKSRAVRQYAQAFKLDPQLAFREVNPQIVENGLVTESLLLAYRRQSAASTAPLIYDDPARIQDLLLQLQQREKDAAAAEAKGAEPPAPAAAGPGARPTVLRPTDLRAGSNLGQATPPGSRPGNPAAGGRQAPPGAYTPGYVPPDASAYQGRQWARPNPVIVNPNMDATQPGTVVTPPPAGLYYRPGPNSTGRLDTQVVPEEGG